MKYLSTSEAAEKWNISSRRVAKLASQNRIEGVTMVGNNWMIPDTASKPEDGRKGTVTSTEADPYRFPDIIFGISSEENPDFLPDEKLLYDGIRKFFRAEYAECIDSLELLSENTNLSHVKIGAYYYLQCAYVANWQFEKVAKAIEDFNDSIASSDSHLVELHFLDKEIKSYEEGAKAISEPFEIDFDCNCEYSKGFLPFIATQYAYSDVISLSTYGVKMNTSYHELICMELEKKGYFYSAILMHLFIAIMYSFEANENKRDLHLRKSFDLVLKHENYSVFGFYLGFYPDLELPLRKYYPEVTVDMIMEISRNRVETSTAYLRYLGGPEFFHTLTPQDYKLLSYSRAGYSINKMADLEMVSVSTVKTRLNKLYAKVNVKNKKELVDKYNDILLNMKVINKSCHSMNQSCC